MTEKFPPPYVQRGAGDVDWWLDQQNPTPKSPDEISRMTPAQRRLLPQVQPSVHARLARPTRPPMNERDRDRSMPAATAAVVGPTKPSVQERNIGETVAAKLRESFPDQQHRMREHLARKRTESGHTRG
jgi:hypothetical protein